MKIDYAVQDAIATLTLNGPENRNAFQSADWRRLDELMGRVEADRAVRVIVLRGAGLAFSGGGDIHTMPERLALPKEARRTQLEEDTRLVRRMRMLDRPIVAMVSGPAMGAGLSLALACDIRIASTSARFGATFHRVGLTADFGLSWLLPRVIGPTAAMDLLLRAQPIDAQRALVLGLVTEVVAPERLEEVTAAYAAQLAAQPPIAIGFTKRGMNLALEHDLEFMLKWEAEAQATCSKTEDAGEGVRAFLAKRAPKFTGR
jgi:2-(1,2-epoxy-1,2-dihydrophenyl)acetyl-CoA isomerase